VILYYAKLIDKKQGEYMKLTFLGSGGGRFRHNNPT
jgi:hypothetical protein